MTASGFGLPSGPSSDFRATRRARHRRQQWTPELAEDVARAESVLFIDCSVDSAPGSVTSDSRRAGRAAARNIDTHHLGAAELLALARELYNSLPRTRSC